MSVLISILNNFQLEQFSFVKMAMASTSHVEETVEEHEEDEGPIPVSKLEVN